MSTTTTDRVWECRCSRTMFCLFVVLALSATAACEFRRVDPASPMPVAAPLFAPYVDLTLWPQPDLVTIAAASHADALSLGFVVTGSAPCTASWGGVLAVNDSWVVQQVSSARAAGVSVVPSFGGAAGTELAQSCTTPTQLADTYQTVIDAYGITMIDFDIEGGALGDAASVDRRSAAMVILQQRASAAARPLTISLTLPVLPTGLTESGLAAVQSALANGVAIDVVNIMAMDYGPWAAPNPAGQMGAYANQAATALQAQLASLIPGATPAQLWRMVGITPMIGQNDVSGEVFTVADAQVVIDFAHMQGVGRVAMWSAARDQACPGGPSPWAQATCSGIDQTPWAFSAVLSA